MSQYIAMNRFRVREGHEAAFEKMWRERDTYLADVPGFVSFRLLRAKTEDGETLFSTHTVWRDEDAFEAWKTSEAFERAHKQARSAGSAMREMHAAPPKLEAFTTVLHEAASA